MELTAPYRNSGRKACFDNFFTSVGLAQELLDNGIESLGTLRSNKKEIPAELLIPKGKAGRARKVGSELNGFHDRIMITSWIPKPGKNILMLSSDPDSFPEQSQRTDSSNLRNINKSSMEPEKKRKTALHSALKLKVI